MHNCARFYSFYTSRVACVAMEYMKTVDKFYDYSLIIPVWIFVFILRAYK